MASPTYEEVIDALKNADAAGDTSAANKLADLADRLRPVKEGTVGDIKLTPDPERSSGKATTEASVIGFGDKAATKVFGAGPTESMDFSQRLERVGEASVGGMAVGGGIGATLGLIGGPGAPATVPAGAATGALIGGVGGALGEIGEQISANMGQGRLAQVLTGLVAGAPAGPVAELGKAGTRITAAAIKALTHPGRVLGKIGDLLMPGQAAATAEKSMATGELRRQADEAARAKLIKGSEGAGEDVGIELQQKVLERQQRATDLAARSEKGKLGETSALRKQQDLVGQEKELAQEKGAGNTKSDFDLGTDLRLEVKGVKDPIAAKAQKEYKAAKVDVMGTASKNEANGVFWGKEAGAQEVLAKWKAKASNLDKPTKDAINSVLDDIWKKTPIKNEWGEITSYKRTYLSAEGVDNIIRKLGDVGYAHEADGYKAIGADIARQMRQDLTKGIENKAGERAGGFYEWSGLGSAKGNYAKYLEEIEKFKTKRGETAIGETQVDVEKIPKTLFGSQSGFNEISGLIPKDKISEYATQYAKNELSGKNVPAIRKWLGEHKYLTDAIPEIKTLAENQLNKLSSLESKSATLQERIAQAGEKTWSSSVDVKAQQWVKELGLETSAGIKKNANVIVADMLESKGSEQLLKATSKYLNDKPEIRAKFPDAVAEWLSKKPASSIGESFSKVKPALEGSGLIDKASLASLESSVNEIIRASKLVAKAGTVVPSFAKEEAAKKIKQLFRSTFALKTGYGGVAGGKAATSVMNREED